MSLDELKTLLRAGDARFWAMLEQDSAAATGLDEVLFLARLRRHAERSLPRTEPAGGATPLRIALLGGCSLRPLADAIEHALAMAGFAPALFVGEYDNYNAEIRDDASAFAAFAPEVTFLLPSERRCRYRGSLADASSAVRAEAEAQADELLALCARVHERGSDVVLANFLPPARFDPGALRVKALGSDWSFRRLVNLELGARAPGYVHVCDLDFLGSRRGLLASRDERRWFESKQPCAPDLMVDVAREVAHLVSARRRATAKVVAVDLDNTLWGGVVGDDGLEGIEIGDTSPRGEAFKAFQRHLLALAERGVLLAVCSKNDHARAVEPFERHPEMVLRLTHFAAFYANWKPKSENLRAIAADLGLGLDSIVFLDDNPAEIEIVRQFAPEVRTLLLGPDPADYATQLQDCRWFEPLAVTAEDLHRGEQYRHEQQRKTLLASVTDMAAYLASLDMTAAVRPFVPVDVPRISQLINKSNQWNLTTLRKSEGDVERVMRDPSRPAFVVRLADRFGEHGLISVVVCEVKRSDDAAATLLEIETWVMSCRVLERQVEEEVMNQVFRIAREHGAARVIGRWRRTAKSDLVRDLYAKLGFTAIDRGDDASTWERAVATYQPYATKIAVRVETA